MFAASKQALKKSGELWIVIQKKQGAPSAKKKLLELFGNVETVAKNKGYYILKSVNN
jgi:16S rRNA (guanine1207-N2)-methyltransferase